MNKLVPDARESVRDISPGATLAVGGFGLSGNPMTLIRALADRGTADLRVVSNNCGTDDWGLGVLLAAGQISRMTSSYVGENKEFARRYLAGELEVALVPQGTLADRLRAGGMGVPALYTSAGVGTQVAEGGLPWKYAPDGSVEKASPRKEIREFHGRPYVLEEAIVCDFALVHAQRGARSWGRRRRHEKRSVAVSSNLHPAAFDELMPKSLATATGDRPLHHAHVCQTTGDSVRLSQALAGQGVRPLT